MFGANTSGSGVPPLSAFEEAPVSDEYDERYWFSNRRTDKTIISKRITDSVTGQKLRIASHIVECAGAGVTNADLSVYRYQKLRRPIWPLDPL